MKIIFENDMKISDVLILLKNFIIEESDEYSILKNKMIVNVSLKNQIGQINPNNEKTFNFGKQDAEELEIYRKKFADERLKDEWSFYTGTYKYEQIAKEITNDYKYLQSAVEKNHSTKNIEKRKLDLKRHEKHLEKEKARLADLKRFIDAVDKNQVEYKYNEYYPSILTKSILFKMDENYIFEYHPEVEGLCYLSKESDSIFEIGYDD